MCGAIRRCDGCAAVQLSLHCVPALVLHSRDAATVAAVATATAAVAEAASYTIVAPLLQDAKWAVVSREYTHTGRSVTWLTQFEWWRVYNSYCCCCCFDSIRISEWIHSSDLSHAWEEREGGEVAASREREQWSAQLLAHPLQWLRRQLCLLPQRIVGCSRVVPSL